jgi:hypothetical protein
MPGVNQDFDGYDEQDGAEAFDEALLDDKEEVNEMRTFEELPDVLDVTRADGDRDEDEALALDADEFDEGAFDDNDLEEDHELDYRAAEGDEGDEEEMAFEADAFDDDDAGDESIEGLDEVADADLVEGGEDDFTNFQAKGLSDEDIERLGYGRRDEAERALDEGLKGTFPASDPVSVTRRED